MLGTIATILWLPIELMWFLFGLPNYTASATNSPSALASIRSTDSCVSTETCPAVDVASSCSDPPVLKESTPTKTIPVATTSSNSAGSRFVVEQISRALQNPSRTLTLTNFVEGCVDSRDALALCDVLEDQKRWHSLHLEDTVEASEYRRWNYKKTGIHRPILQQASQNNLAVTCNTTIVMRTEKLTTHSMVSLMESWKSDSDVKNLHLIGQLSYYQDMETIALALVSLIGHDNRTWKNIHWNIKDSNSNNSSGSREAQLVERVCHKALEKATGDRYITLEWNP